MEQDQTRRDEPGFCISHGSDRLFGVVGFELGLPVNDIVGMFIERNGTTVARAQIFEQFNSRTGRRAQCCDAQTGAEHVVEMILFGAVIFTFAGHAETQKITIEPETGVGVGNDDGGMIDSEEQPVAVLVPLGVALAFGEV